MKFGYIVLILLVVLSEILMISVVSGQRRIHSDEEYVLLSIEGPVEILSAQVFQYDEFNYVAVTFKGLGGTTYTEIHKLESFGVFEIDGFKIRYIEQGNLDE